jgi:hypothetical protein
LNLTSIQASPDTKVSLLSQAGDLAWTQDARGLHVKVERRHTIQLIRKPGTKPGDPIQIVWGPDWPVAVKITHAKPAVAAAPGR